MGTIEHKGIVGNMIAYESSKELKDPDSRAALPNTQINLHNKDHRERAVGHVVTLSTLECTNDICMSTFKK